MIRRFLNRSLVAQIDAYSKTLASNVPSQRDEVIRVHQAKLVVNTEPELRLRSLQTLTEAGDESALALLVNELVGTCRNWPSSGHHSAQWLLLDCCVNLFNSRVPPMPVVPGPAESPAGESSSGE